ncbi:MAG: hypothetical protein WAK55_12265 [Xanthobacteraceae bacterium]
MRTYVSCIALGVAVAAMAPVASAQTLVAQPYQAAQPYQTYIVPPSGTLMTPTALVAVPAGVLQPVQLQTVQPVPVIRPVAHHRIAPIHHVAVIHSSHPLYDTAVPAVPPPAVVAPAVIAPVVAPAPGQVLNVSGQFQCIQGCAGGLPGLAFVTQNGWDLNLVNELGQPTRAWVDWPGHIWAQSWNEGAVYSPDGMTIQFDNGAVWQRSLQLLQPIPTYSR